MVKSNEGGPSRNSQKAEQVQSSQSSNKTKSNFKMSSRNRGGIKKNLVKIKKSNTASPIILQALKKKRRRPMKETASGGETDKVDYVSPRQKFAIFKPPSVSGIITAMHPTQKEAEIKEYDEQPILKVHIEKMIPENGVNGKNEQPEPIIEIENEPKAENNGHHHHDMIDHEEEIVDVVAISEAEAVPVIPETEDPPVYEDNGNGVPEEIPFMSPRLRGSAKKRTSSSRSSSPADSLHKERASRKLNYVQPVAEVPVEEKLEVSVIADLDEPLIVEGGAEDLEVSAAVPVVEKSPAKPRTPAKVASPSRSKKTPKLPVTPVEEEVSGRRSRKPKSDEKKQPHENATPRASMSMMDEVDYKPLSGRAGSAIRSVKARRPIRRSRNISALDSSLHNQSSPWDEEYKILSPRGGESLIDTSLFNGEGSPLSVSVAQKRKVSEDELDAKDTKKAKNESSHTSSFFSIVTSPICALKEKFRGGSLSSSTPFQPSGAERKTGMDSDASMLSADENVAEEHAEEAKSAATPVATPEAPANRWCAVM